MLRHCQHKNVIKVWFENLDKEVEEEKKHSHTWQTII